MHISFTLKNGFAKERHVFRERAREWSTMYHEIIDSEQAGYSLKVRGSEFLLEDTKPLGKISLVYYL